MTAWKLSRRACVAGIAAMPLAPAIARVAGNSIGSITRFDSDGSLTRFHVQVAALVLPAMGLRYLSFPRLATAIEAMAVKMTISAGFAFASVILAATNRPLVDAMLHRWDLAIGFDWRTAMAMLASANEAVATVPIPVVNMW